MNIKYVAIGTLAGISLLYIDLFCGAGGTSTGVESARVQQEKCALVIGCVNHDQNAIASHASNHPDAKHFTEDIRTLDLTELVEHTEKMKKSYPFAKVVLWASLECTNFSKAKGGMPRDADSRTLAEHLFRYIEALKPDSIQIENVEEFMSWGKVCEFGKPISRDKGRDFMQWIKKVKSYGYSYDYRILNAADFGALTSRKRYFAQFAKPDFPVVWPEQTHAKEISNGLFNDLEKWRPVKEVLDFNDEGVSIFGRKKPLAEKTLERIYAGLIKFVAGGKDKWILKYNSMNAKGVHIPPSVDEPCPVVSTQGRLGIVQTKFLSKYYSGKPEHKNISVEGPAHTIKTIDSHALVQTKFLSAYYGNGDNVSSVENPAPTVTTKDRIAKVQCNFIDMQYGNGFPSDVNEPAGTVTANPKHNLITCKPWIMDASFSNVGSTIDEPSKVITANRKWHYLMNPQFNSAGGSVEKPSFTLIARMDKMPPYLVAAENGNIAIEIYDEDSPNTVKIKEFMAVYGIVDIKMRMLKIPELKQIMGFPKDYILIGTQAEQKKYIGNAVEVTIARKICEAISNTLHERRKIA